MDGQGMEKQLGNRGSVGGILNVNKPRGMTSRAVVNRVAEPGRACQGGACRDSRSAGDGRPGRLRWTGNPAGGLDSAAAQVVPHGDPPGRTE